MAGEFVETSNAHLHPCAAPMRAGRCNVPSSVVVTREGSKPRVVGYCEEHLSLAGVEVVTSHG